MQPISEHPIDQHPYLGVAEKATPAVRVVLPVPGSGERAAVEINGVDVANCVLGLDLTADGQGNRVLTLRLPFDELKLEHCTKLSVPEWTHPVLVALGWTPPVEDSDTKENR